MILERATPSVVEHDASTVEVAKPPIVTTRRDVLHRAADLIEEFGWTQGIMGMGSYRPDALAPFCLLGAVAQASYDFGGRRCGNDYKDAAAALSHDYDAIDEVWDWNDDRCRTKAEVIAKLREAAEQSGA